MMKQLKIAAVLFLLSNAICDIPVWVVNPGRLVVFSALAFIYFFVWATEEIGKEK